MWTDSRSYVTRTSRPGWPTSKMETKDRNAILIVVGLVAGLGCCGVVGIVGLGFWGAAMTPVVPPTSPPIAAPVAPAVAPGWASYAFAADCSARNPNLRLRRLTVTYPTTHTVLPCPQQHPRPWAYVTFHLEGASGEALSQWTVSNASGMVDFDVLARAADGLAAEIGAPPTQPIRQDQLAARGTSLLRRDSTFTVPATRGAFVPATYIYRQVVVPNPTAPDGVVVTYVAVTTNPTADLAANDADLMRVLESIAF